jgi:glutamine synthetase
MKLSPALEHEMQLFSKEVKLFLEKYPDTSRIELLFPDMNGFIRGKWLPIDALPKLSSGSVRLPQSTYVLNVWGSDVPEVGLAQEVGDPDGVCLPVVGSLAIVPWAQRPTAQVLMKMLAPNEITPTDYDSREILAAQVAKLKAKGLTAVVATELEFYLVSEEQTLRGHPKPPTASNGQVLDQPQTYDMNSIDYIEAFLNDVDSAGKAQNLPIDTTIAEVGPGQFEINLVHEADALLAADQAVLLKRVIKRVAQRHDLLATFMAKPYGDQVGSGMHIHCSLLNEQGENIFSSGSEDTTADRLKYAIGGLLETTVEAQAIFAPHQNSYRRFQPGSFAPVTPCWGYDHRGAALRIPATNGAGARLEHRISGADVNPYLAVSAVLAGIIHGLEQQINPGEPLAMDGDTSLYPQLETDWKAAISNFENSDLFIKAFGENYHRAYSQCKYSEQAVFAKTVTDFESQTYLHRV